MVMYFKANCMQGRSSGTARAMGGNALSTSMAIRRDLSAHEGKKTKKKAKPKTGRVKPKPHQHPLGKNFVKR